MGSTPGSHGATRPRLSTPPAPTPRFNSDHTREIPPATAIDWCCVPQIVQVHLWPLLTTFQQGQSTLTSISRICGAPMHTAGFRLLEDISTVSKRQRMELR